MSEIIIANKTSLETISAPIRQQVERAAAETGLSKNRRALEAETQARVESSPRPRINLPANIHLQFQVDPVTNEVTILLVDQTNQQVIRTIPPEELAKIAKLSQRRLIDIST
jgi:uncharacterized FlaG/YvyC family protein